MKNIIIKRVVMAAFVGMLGVGSLAAQTGRPVERPEKNAGHDRIERVGEKMEMMKEAFASLDLTDDQKAQIAELQEEFRGENEVAIEELRKLAGEAREQMQKGDREGAQATREEMKAKGEALKEGVRDLREQIALILTDEQKAALKELHGKGGDHKAHGKPGDCPGMGDVLEKLNLTEQQKGQIKELRENFKGENAGTIEGMKALREEMRSQIESGDKEGAAATRKEMKTLREEMRTNAEALRRQIGAILTDEQKALLAEHRSELGECREHHKGEGREGKRKGDRAPATEGERPADIE